jgi:hypothetical protein
MSSSVVALPNSTTRIQEHVGAGRVTWVWPLVMMVSRFVLFALWQVVIAGVYALQGDPAAWESSIAWWPVTATLTNLVSLWLLSRLARWEGFRWRDVIRFERSTLKRDLLTYLGLSLISLPVAILPNIAAGTLLFGDAQQALNKMLLPLPVWAAIVALVAFPITIALAELPTYYAYVMPRLQVLSGRKWIAIVLPAFWLAAQHCTLPLIFDSRFILWRFAMFLPFALLIGIVVHWRPRLLPYVMIGHGLLDLQMAVMILSTSL